MLYIACHLLHAQPLSARMPDDEKRGLIICCHDTSYMHCHLTWQQRYGSQIIILCHTAEAKIHVVIVHFFGL